MALQVEPLHPLFGARVRNVDIRQPLSSDLVTAIDDAMVEYGVLVFHDQALTDEQQLDFAGSFGIVDTKVRTHLTRLSEKLSDISNIAEDNTLRPRDDETRLYGIANRLWHTDSSFRAVPAKYSMLSAREVPEEGGETQFVDMRVAYEALPDAIKDMINGLSALHVSYQSRRTINFLKELPQDKLPPVERPLVRGIPGSSRKSLFLASHASHIIGWPVPEGRMLLLDLIELATQPQLVYTHYWKTNDFVMWDNRITMHRARLVNHTARRDLRRSTLQDTEADFALPA
jgi:alpha-ketoglutarate-dependent 2,4-dichlorophenoxyacetate dioxygenase